MSEVRSLTSKNNTHRRADIFDKQSNRRAISGGKLIIY